MNNQDPMAVLGLKYDPSLPSIPVSDLWRPPGLKSFYFRIQTLLRHGGFGLVTGESGLGKSKVLQMIADWLTGYDELAVAVMQRPQSSTADFYRELGDLFGVELSVANRYGGFKALRARFLQHIQTTLMRPVLLIDEAQEVCAETLTELRLMSSADFDSRQLITVILCGDDRLPERFRQRSLIPFGGRIRARLVLQPFDHATLLTFLEHLFDKAGGPHLMTQSLRESLVTHSAGNLRILTTMVGDILSHGAENSLTNLDDEAFFAVFGGTIPRRQS